MVHLTTLGTTFVLGLLIAIWSANAGMKAIFNALNVVYEVKEKRGLLRLNLTSLAFTIAALTAVLLMIAGVVAVPLALQWLGLGERAEWIIILGRWPALLFLLLTALACFTALVRAVRMRIGNGSASALSPRACSGKRDHAF